MIPGLFDLLPGKECCRSGWIVAGLAFLVLALCGLTIGVLKNQRDRARLEIQRAKVLHEVLEARVDAANVQIQAIEAKAKADREKLLADLPKNATREQVVAWALRHRGDR